MRPRNQKVLRTKADRMMSRIVAETDGPTAYKIRVALFEVMKEIWGDDPSAEQLVERSQELVDGICARPELADVPRAAIAATVGQVIRLYQDVWINDQHERALCEKLISIQQEIGLIWFLAEQVTVLPDEVMAELDRLLRAYDAMPDELKYAEIDAKKIAAGELDEGPERNEQAAIFIEMMDVMRWMRDQHLTILKARHERDAEARRRARIESHRTPDVEIQSRTCATCGRRPARVDDLCKRCAHDAGKLPHGKIGEG